MQGRQVFVILAIAALFGVFLPLYKGLDFLDTRLIVAYACLSAVVAASSVADAFAQAPQDGALTKMLRVWFYSWGFALLLLAMALGTVEIAAHRRFDHLVRLPTWLLLSAECLSATSAAAVVAAGAVMTRLLSANATRTAFRFVFLIAVVSLFLADRYGVATPPTARLTRLLYIASGVCGAAALLLAAVYQRVGAADQ